MSGLSLERLIFDPANLAQGPLVGSYLIGSSGTLLSDTTPGILDVNITNSLDVDLDGVYSVGNTNPDNVGIIGHVRAASPADTDQTGRLTYGQANADDVVAANVHALDVNSFLMGFDGTTWDRLKAIAGVLEVNISSITNALTVVGNVADDAVDSGNPVKVGSRALNQGTALTALSAANDRADLVSDLYRRIFINDAPNIAVNHAVVTVGTTEVAIPTIPGMTRVLLQNVSDRSIFVGATGVATSGATRGIEIFKNSTLALECGEAIALYAISSAAGKDLVAFRLA
jgi:hypothetical protein